MRRVKVPARGRVRKANMAHLFDLRRLIRPKLVEKQVDGGVDNTACRGFDGRHTSVLKLRAATQEPRD